MVKLLKKLVFKLYVICLMLFTVWYGHFMYPLIFGFEGKEEAGESLKEIIRTGSEEETMFSRLIAEQTETSQTDLGYRVIDESYIEGRFHHIGFTLQHDNTNVCIRCHGSVPHDGSKETRSFLNQHAFYLACETCHSRPRAGAETWTFNWYDKVTGKITGNPRALVEIEEMFTHEHETEQYPTYGNYGVKIAPTQNDSGIRKLLHGEKEMALAERYIAEQELLEPDQKTAMKEVLHRKVSKDHPQCRECHNQEDRYLPFEKLGYPPTRLRELVNVPVVNMIQKYQKFHFPTLLESDEIEK
ncbi:MAG: hypothetical protein OEY09_00715 [Gammaproteobacteria bacterium]|nr:hypothetical protein [Gammaproteobacteria bacterium]